MRTHLRIHTAKFLTFHNNDQTEMRPGLRRDPIKTLIDNERSQMRLFDANASEE